MIEEFSDSLAEWAFPDVHNVVKSADIEPIFLNETINELEPNFKPEEVESLNETSIPETPNVNQEAENDLQNLKQEYQNRIEFVNTLLTDLKNPALKVDEEAITLIQDVIKKITKKIIYKEITADSHLIIKIIEEMKTFIPANNGALNIYISEMDFNNLITENNDPSIIFNVQSDLEPGDIIIKSNVTEIRAILNERIEQLIEVSND